VALTQKAPFVGLKTHGLLLDEHDEKMSKSYSQLCIDPEDLISGTEKIDG
jgi:valyl-tRNA synthetase